MDIAETERQMLKIDHTKKLNVQEERRSSQSDDTKSANSDRAASTADKGAILSAKRPASNNDFTNEKISQNPIEQRENVQPRSEQHAAVAKTESRKRYAPAASESLKQCELLNEGTAHLIQSKCVPRKRQNATENIRAHLSSAQHERIVVFKTQIQRIPVRLAKLLSFTTCATLDAE